MTSYTHEELAEDLRAASAGKPLQWMELFAEPEAEAPVAMEPAEVMPEEEVHE